MDNNSLQHFGVRGMRWGVRRSRSRSTSTKKSPGRKKAKDMTDEELRKKVNRLQLERQYKQLAAEVGRSSKGKQHLQKIFKAGTTVAAVSTTAITLHNNANKIKEIVNNYSK